MGSSLCCLRDPDTTRSTMGITSTFSVEEQELQLKAARREEQRLRREAEKVNALVRHESAKFD
ncbi:PREDICTED: uncharacterized protein LOC104785251 [Camelina sativa]|uniref:Uncharacterized protein LOC104785251 n=1 Tax=Camelina sativa TaxID=90675 RepID=A0ABM0Z0J0_CAMSA|nr:PREDICTED: uncharacterized protein LOC104785251 [Camelina sativa]